MTARKQKKRCGRSRRLWCLLLAVLLFCSGCGHKAGLREGELFSMGGSVCSTGEMMLYVLSEKAIFHEAGSALWDKPVGESRFEDHLKDSLYSYLEQLFLMDAAAQSEGIRLGDAEEEKADAAAAAYLNVLSEETRQQWGITETVVREACRRYLRAMIYYRKVMHETQVEISEEEARVIRIQIVEVDKSLGLSAAQDLLAKINAGTALGDALKDVPGAVTHRENAVRGQYEESFEKLVFSLRTNKWSPVIPGKDKYYLVQCLKTNLPEDTAVNRRKMEREAYREALQQRLEEISEKSEYIYNPDIWEAVDLSGISAQQAVNFFDYAALMGDGE